MSADADIESLLATLYHPGLKRIAPGLERVEQFLAALGNPQMRAPPVIHVAGTNGKGSLIAYLQAIFACAGKRVHRYISPHLVRFNERIVLAGEEIDSATLLGHLKTVQALAQEIPVTFFEATTAAAFLAFAEHPADVLLLETGMGGRLDATNVIAKPLLTAITPIGYDHMEFLGDSLEQIAWEKAGILKPGVPCVVGPQAPEAREVIRRAAAEKNAPLFMHGEEWGVRGDIYHSKALTLQLTPSLEGVHQLANAATAAACVECLPEWNISVEATARGISGARWPGRLQRLEQHPFNALLPPGSELWLDGGHNPHAAAALAAWAQDWAQDWAQARRELPLAVICGMTEKKDPAAFLAPLRPHAARIIGVAIPEEPLSLPASAVAEETAATLPEALRRAAEQGPARVLICGSLYLAGRVLSWRA